MKGEKRLRLGTCSALSVAFAVACSGAQYGPTSNQSGIGVTVPTPIAEGKRGEDEPPAPPPEARDGGATGTDAGATGTDAPNGAGPELSATHQGSLPDPEPLRLARQWQYAIVNDHGRLRVDGVSPLVYPKPIVTARRMGRYAIELWIGHELVERVRFDFPLLAADEPPSKPVPGKRRSTTAPSFAAGNVVTQRVLVPDSPRATQAVLVDRATGVSEALPWPPNSPLLGAGSSEKPAR